MQSKQSAILTKFLTAAKTADLAGVSRWTLRREWQAGRFPPPTGIDGRFREDWLLAWQEGKRDWSGELAALRRTEAAPLRPARPRRTGAARGAR